MLGCFLLYHGPGSGCVLLAFLWREGRLLLPSDVQYTNKIVCVYGENLWPPSSVSHVCGCLLLLYTAYFCLHDRAVGHPRVRTVPLTREFRVMCAMQCMYRCMVQQYPVVGIMELFVFVTSCRIHIYEVYIYICEYT